MKTSFCRTVLFHFNPRRAAIRLLSVAGVALVSTISVLGQGGYRYGEAWWREYPSNDDTILLFHFGAPQEIESRKELVATVTATAEEEALFDDLATDTEPPLLDIALDPEAYRRGPQIDSSSVPDDHVQDYANPDRQVMLPEGMKKTPDGRFGAGLACTGGHGLGVDVQAPVSLELNVRIDRLPEETQCLWSIGDDASRLLLHPDGTLELKLKLPHGEPGAYPGLKDKPGEAERAAVFARDATIRSPHPVPLGEWVHVRVYNHPHPTPGGGEPWDARLVVDGREVAAYQSERYNINRWLGHRETRFVLGNDAAHGAGFTGLVDQVRLLSRANTFYERVPTTSREASHQLQFDKPWFRADATHFHASLDRGVAFDRHDGGATAIAVLNVPDELIEGIAVDGVRGRGWLLDPEIGFARVPLDGMTFAEGSLEFWLRPVNWDDVTGYWHHSPPRNLNLGVLRLYGRDAAGKPQRVATIALPRAHNIERSRIPLDAGRWTHVVARWKDGRGTLFLDGRSRGGFRLQTGDLSSLPPPAFAEFGIDDDVMVMRHEPPRIEIDEIVGYRAALREDEIRQARERWFHPLEPIELYNTRLEYKWSLSKLEFDVTPLLPEGVIPAACEAMLYNRATGERIARQSVADLDRGAFRFVLNDSHPLPDGEYLIRFRMVDPDGALVAEGEREWNYAEEPWRHSRAGILDFVPEPWTSIRVDGNQLVTRMSRYTLGTDGLPRQIHADGVALLAEPFQILEDGRRLSGTMGAIETDGLEARWRATFAGRTLDLHLDCRLEYDGMIRYDLRVEPRGGPVATLQFVMPLESDRATRYLAYPAGARGPFTGVVAAHDGVLVSSRTHPDREARRAFGTARKANPDLEWEDFLRERRENRRAWGFYNHAGLNDLNRGLWWFCDNAAGWAQSQAQGAVEIVRRGEAVAMELNLIAEAGEYADTRPIVFAVLPHPARPMPDAYRLFNRVAPELDPVASNIYDAFRPWPRNPRDGEMRIYPAPDPKQPEQGPSWDYAESCIPFMKSAMPHGTRTLYLSLMWLSCRAGAYDNWEWRSGHTSAVSLTPSLVNYLCWEMNEWIGRDIWDAIYLDEIYELPARKLEAGFSIRLPDGTEQPGLRNFDVRDLMKRWRNIFHAHNRQPIVIAHLTNSFLYHALVYCDSYLDGENTPIVSLNSRDWIDSTSQTRFEVIQNGSQWGLSSFFMPFIAEGGFANKEESRFPVWQWRQARQAQSMFAHFEVATVYEGQGAQVYRTYWRELLDWGVGDPQTVEFVPYWKAAPAVQVDDQGGATWVSYYRDEGRVLLLASNRRKTDETLHIALDFAALGLPPTARVRSLDGTLEPPPGEDFKGAGKAALEAQDLMERQLDLLSPNAGGDDLSLDVDEILLDPDVARQSAREAFQPRLEGNLLVLPVRARDYRVVAIE